MKILLIEEDEILIANLTKHLTEHHYIVDVVKDSETAWSYGSTFEYDLFIFDITSPNLNGINLCHRFRVEGYMMPILLITENISKVKVNGLDAGADDCVVKPFDMPELVARVRALLRRSNASSFPLLVWGDLLLNPSTCEVSYNSQPLTLTNKEYELLELLLRDSQHLLSADEILDRLWSSDDFPSEATVRSHIRRLRHKLVQAGAPSDFVATVHGRGYYLKAPDKTPDLVSAKTSQISNLPDLSGVDFPLTPIVANSSLSFTIKQPQAAIKLMVVDDDIDYLRSLPELLAPWEFKVTTLDDPQEFWSVLEAVLPDILVLDVNIPPFDGIEICQVLRSYPQWQRLPVLFLSAVSDRHTQNLAFSVGADDYLCKPISGIDLANRIRNRLQRISAYTKN
jgi:DNA-binding response OmpR family regulator